MKKYQKLSKSLKTLKNMKNFKKYEKYQKSKNMGWGREAGETPAALAAPAPNSVQWPP